ncbi:hypothetical protein V8B55DRAFT_1433443 [Mucor lusitanicus]|uniref:Galactose oxidase n=2 Tax=Mucor circinelloides f. lusitanicus TaxID=29924 RepID=A0A168HXT1_MUCCL|nr:hypothetical protein MUCCIDRAFT_114501 [Mucor lusitanicus CBS 277.49]
MYSVSAVPGAVPVPGKPVYIPQANAIYVFSFSKNTQSDNKLSVIDLKQSFNTLQPPVTDISSQITNDQCPVMHFATALPDADGVSVNVFGAGSNVNGVYESTMTICQYNTQSSSWKQIISPVNAPLARRNAAYEFTHTNLTFIFGGSSEAITGLSASSSYYPNYWHQDVPIYDSKGEQWLNTGLTYASGPTRANATITQISDTNGQLVVIGGSLINNSSSMDMVTNFPLANMTDIVVLDPRTSRWSNIGAGGGAIPTARKHHTTTLHPDGHTLIVIGGEYFNDTGAYLLNDVWTLDTRDMNSYTWSQPPVQGAGLYRSNHTSILIGDQIWVIAGTNASAKAVDIQLLNVTDWTWSYHAVSNYVAPPSSDKYQSIGGTKGLIGIIVGVVGALLLALLCISIWWCRRKQVKPFSKDGKSLNNASMAVPYADDQNMSHYDENYSQQMQYNNVTGSHHRPSQDVTAVLANSKITSHPSLSTTTSHNNMAAAADWSHQQQTLTNHPPNINTAGNNHFNAPQYGSNNAIPLTPTMISPIDRSQPQYYDNNYFTDSNNNIYHEQNYGPGYVSAASNAAVHQSAVDTNNHQRQSFGYWDVPPPPHFSSDANNNVYHQMDNHHNFMLTPMGRADESGRPISPPSRTQLQKPNEVDTILLTSPDASATVYTTSTAEDDHTATPGNFSGSDDPLVQHHPNHTAINKN